MTGEGAAGLATGLAIGEMRRAEEEAKGRRKANMGQDQIVIETKLSIEKAGKAIAAIYTNWMYRDEEIVYSGNRGYSFGIAVAVSIIVFFLLSAWCIVSYGHDDIRYTLTAFESAGIVTAAGIVCGFLGFFKDDYETVEYIRLSEIKRGGTRILIKVYDDDGRRNIDEDSILKIQEVLS
jgi:hypothetical protein